MTIVKKWTKIKQQAWMPFKPQVSTKIASKMLSKSINTNSITIEGGGGFSADACMCCHISALLSFVSLVYVGIFHRIFRNVVCGVICVFL